MSLQRSYSIPSTLPILPLPPGQVLYPSLVLSVQLASKHSIALLQSVLREAEQQASGKYIFIGCAPVKPSPPEGGATEPPPLVTPPTSDEEDTKPLRVIKLPISVSRADKLGKPAKEDLFEYGCAARIRLSTGGFVVILEGISRIALSLEDYGPPSLPFHETTVTLLTTTPLPPNSPLLATLQSISTTLLATLASTSPLSALLNRRLKSLITNLNADTAPALVDALMGSIPTTTATGLTFQDKLNILAAVDGEARVELGVEILSRCDESLNLKKRIGDKVDQNLSRRQREYLLMQQLQAIRQELEELAAKDGGGGGIKIGGGSGARKGLPSAPGGGEDDEDDEVDDMAELEKAVKAKKWTEESRKVAMKELRRLKKSPPQGAEHGVIRNYLDWLLALPWNDSTPLPLSRDFITAARDKLNDDHYGLDKVKKRLLEWLAVLRLKQEQWELDNPPPPAPLPTTAAPAASTELVLHESSGGPPAMPPLAPIPPPSSATTKPRDKGPILLLCGPPGTGKTSIARSLADAMGRKFYRISLGGVRDEAEIRGHRRTYVSALPGALAQALKVTGVNNPVILLDEVDKLGASSTHGDPGAALLEVLDPEQNWCFKDHYLDIPLDLSSVLFIATANDLSTISDPLYDRMEVIELSGYVHSEKLHIAKRYLLPKQLKANSLTPTLVHLSDEALLHLITSYTHEAGVRSLERELGAVCRAKAVEYAEAKDRAREKENVKEGEAVSEEMVKAVGYVAEVTAEDVERILGVPKYDREELEKENMVGVSTGLAYQGSGNGGVLHIESTTLPGHGSLHLTGQLGEVISESAELAFAWVKSHAYELGISESKEEDAFSNVDVHIHMPAGSIRKDGPSAGVAMVVAMVSLMRGIPQLQGVAMTGEITLRGLVTPVGGIKEKVLGAHRAGIHTLLLPFKNAKDVTADLPPSIQEECTFIYTRTIWDALEAAFGKERLWEGRGGPKELVGAIVESRL
uniref:Lon protease homolog n=1 Tax=Leucosporidium scottii TaxID=5278 RepID=A0A0H5GA14_9BASI|nr:hypothetical protein ls5930a1_00188 [Leucosporidium scottii]